jgi:threonine/homoserine/homoserine lactone efflux protein
MTDVLPEASVLLPFVLASVVIALTPGPDMTFFVGRALSQGRAAGLAAFAGATTGILVHTLLVALGLSALLVAAPKAFLALKLIGALYLLWLAVQAIRHGSVLSLPANASVGTGSLRAAWAQGLLVNLLNPKIVIFFMTFLPQFVAVGDPDATARFVTLGLVFIAIGAVICVPIIFAADRVARALRGNARAARVLDYLFASIFAAFAARLLFARAH